MVTQTPAPKKRNKWLIGCGAVVALGVIIIIIVIAATCSSSGTPKNTNSTSAPKTIQTTTSVNQTSITSSTSMVAPQLIKEWTGTGIKTTEPFDITDNEWYIEWSSDPQIIDGQSVGILQIMVYDTQKPDSLITLAANTNTKGSDKSYVYKSGKYYLTINAANTQWMVKIYD